MTVYLSILIFLPAVAGTIGLFLPKRLAPWVLVLGTVLTLAYSIVALARVEGLDAHAQAVEIRLAAAAAVNETAPRTESKA